MNILTIKFSRQICRQEDKEALLLLGKPLWRTGTRTVEQVTVQLPSQRVSIPHPLTHHYPCALLIAQRHSVCVGFFLVSVLCQLNPLYSQMSLSSSREKWEEAFAVWLRIAPRGIGRTYSFRYWHKIWKYCKSKTISCKF